MEEKILRLLFSKLEDQIADKMSFLGGGGCKSFDEYKEVCGAIRGLRTAQRELNDLVEKLKEADDD